MMPPSTPSAIFDQIINQTRKRVERAKRDIPAKILLRSATNEPTRDFVCALQNTASRGLMPVIAESKASSPSAGPLITPEPYSATHICQQWEALGATCLSVLTEPDWFGGHLSDLRSVRSACHLPILRKDFIVDPYQIIESRAAGADCVLLLLNVLSDTQAQECLEQCTQLGLAVLVEAFDTNELARATALDRVKMIGINNRNLSTLTTNTNHFQRLATQAQPWQHNNKNRLLIAESGLRNPEDIASAAQAGAQAVLVGETLLRHRHNETFIRQMCQVPLPGPHAP